MLFIFTLTNKAVQFSKYNFFYTLILLVEMFFVNIKEIKGTYILVNNKYKYLIKKLLGTEVSRIISFPFFFKTL